MLAGKFTKFVNTPAAIAFAFAFVLTLAEAVVFRQGYLRFFRSSSGADDFVFVLFSFGALVFFIRSMLVSRFGWQCVYFAIFAFALSVEYGFHDALGRFTLPTDFENTFYATDASDKFEAITLFFSWLAFVPVIAFRLLFRLADETAIFGARLFALNLLLVFGGFALSADFHRYPSPPVNAFAAHFNNLTVSALYLENLKRSPQMRQKVAPMDDRAAPQNNVVFIVDESVRADHLSLNGYPRETTPTLQRLKRENLLQNWGAGVSGATESVGSNRLLLTGLSDLPDRENLIYKLPTIFQYARAAGYRTYYFDAQGYSEWIGNVADREDFGRIYEADDFPGVAQYDLDRAFAGRIKEIVGGSKGNFIWVNKHGVHFRYEKNYPAEEKIWSPTDREAEPTALETNRPLENNYDNALRYNSESFFATLFAGDFPANTVFVCTSDHGQTLVQDRAPHAGASSAEALVPIFIVGKDERLNAADTAFAAAHRNLFPTLLDFMNYPKERRARNYAPSLLEARAADSKPRSFFVGKPSGAFGGRLVVFDVAEKAESEQIE